MEPDELTKREVILANGDRFPLGDVVRHQLSLLVQSRLDPLEWDVVYHLRELCFGQPLDPPLERYLIREGLLRQDGSIDPGLRSVILSSVRGEGRRLSLESPYTNASDRAVGDYLVAREFLHVELDPAQTRALLDMPPLDKGLFFMMDKMGPPPDVPPPTDPEAESFVRRLEGRLNRPGRPPSPPPPPPK